MMIEIKCYEIIGMCFFMLFFLTVKCQCKFYSKFNFPKQMSGDFFGTQAFTIFGATDDLIVFIVCHQFVVIS